MKKYRVSIACVNKRNSEIIKEQLDNLLGELIDFECVDCNDNMDLVLGSNLILASGNRAANLISNILMDNTDILIIRRTIRKENFEKLVNIPDDTKILVVNDDLEMSDRDIVGNSNSIKKTIQIAENFSRFDSPVLIQGETGTGKELFAKAFIIHPAGKKAHLWLLIVQHYLILCWKVNYLDMTRGHLLGQEKMGKLDCLNWQVGEVYS